jgi:hypothetical protein
LTRIDDRSNRYWGEERRRIVAGQGPSSPPIAFNARLRICRPQKERWPLPRLRWPPFNSKI